MLLRRSADPLRLFERAAPAISDLPGLPTLDDRLRLALILLAQDGYGPGQPPDPVVTAKVLDKPVELVEQVRAAIRRPDEVAFEVLTPRSTRTARLGWPTKTPRPTTTRSSPGCARALSMSRRIPSGKPVADGLDPARRLLGVGLRPLNAAIRALGAPYRPLIDPDGIGQQFRPSAPDTGPIVDALRATFLEDFRAARPLDRYVASRKFARPGG